MAGMNLTGHTEGVADALGCQKLSLQIEVVDDALRRQQGLVRFQIVFAVVIACTGVACFVVVHFLPHSLVPDDQKWLMSLGATFVSSLCGFPLHALVTALGRISSLQILTRSLAQSAATNSPLDPWLEECVRKTFHKSLEL
jgi:hypothetical protein